MNKDLFIQVYKNKVLNIIINNQIRYIHKKINKHSKKLKWNQLTPEILSYYGYYHQFIKLGTNYDILKCGKAAARHGHLHILKYIVEQCHPYNKEKEKFLRSAFKGGNISVIEYLYPKVKMDTPYLNYAAIGGLDACKWIVNQKVYSRCLPHVFFEKAISSGNLDTLKWGINFFHCNNWAVYTFRIPTLKLWTSAVKKNNIALLDYMYIHTYFNRVFDANEYIVYAIESSNIEVIDWIFSKEDDQSLDNVKVISSLIDCRSIRIIKFCSIKLGCDNVNIAEWFYKKVEQHGFNAIDLAIQQKNHKIVIWMYENTNLQGTINPLHNCKSLDLIKWFTEHNRPERIPPYTLRSLIRMDGHFSMIEYIIRNRTEQFPQSDLNLSILLNSDSVELLDMLSKNKKYTISNYSFDRVIKRNKIESVKWIHNNTTIGCTEDGILSAYLLEDSTMIEWLHQNRTESCDSEQIKTNFNNFSTSVRSFIFANKPEMIPSNVLEIVCNDFSHSKFIIDNYPNENISEDSLFTVSKSGNVEVVKYLHQYYKKHDINAKTNHFNISAFNQSLKFAIENQFSDIFRYLYENRPKIKTSNGFKLLDNPLLYACKYGSLDICKYLQENTQFKLSIDHIDQASVNGHIHLVKWIYENHGIKCSNKAIETTASNQHFNIVRYLLDNKHVLTSSMFKNSIENQNLEFVKICHQYQCKHDFNVVDFASSCGYLEIVKYLVQNGHKGTTEAIDSASELDHLNIIIYLRENNHKCTSKSIKNAISKEHTHILKWLLANIEFPSSEIPLVGNRMNDIRELLVEYINKQKIKENEKNKKRQSEPISKPTNKKIKNKNI